jgi:hypothetical protein
MWAPARGHFFSAATVAMSTLYMPLVKRSFELLSCR